MANWLRVTVVLGLFCVLYSASYFTLSRIGYWKSQKYGLIKAFYYFPDATKEYDYIEEAACRVFFPINKLDQWLLDGPAQTGPSLGGFN